MSNSDNVSSNAAVGVIRTLYERVATGDFPGVVALMDEEIVVTQAASLPFGGVWRGKPNFLDMAGRIGSAWPGFAVEPLSFMSDGQERVVVWARLRGKGLDMEMLEMWRVREGLVIACQPFYFDSAAALTGVVLPPA